MNIKIKSRILATVFLLAGLPGARAEQQEAQTDVDSSGQEIEKLFEIPVEELAKVQATSIASGTEKPTTETPATTTIITAQEIAAIGARTFEEALESVPGLYVNASGPVGQARFFFRGIATNFNPEVLVMINGIPIKNIIRSDQNGRLGVIPVPMISRIEVIRGPGSALYGADAFAGVINVVTKDATEIRGTNLGGNAGSYSTYQGWFFQSYQAEDFKASLMLDYQTTNGYDGTVTADAQTALDRGFGTRASLAPGPLNLEGKWLGLFFDAEKGHWRLRGSYYGVSNLGTAQGVGQALDPSGRESKARSIVDLTYHSPEIAKNWDLTSRLAYRHEYQQVDQNLVLFPPGANLGQGVFPNGVLGSPEYWTRNLYFDNSVLYTGIDHHRIRFGAGYAYVDDYQIRESKNFTSTFAPLPEFTNVSDTPAVYLPETSRNDFYGFVQDEWTLSPSLELTLGARYDLYSDFGGTFNPRGALVWKTTQDLTTKLLYGRAFRAPSFADLYTMNNPVTIGNPNLKPETINTYELALDYQVNPDWLAEVTAFHYVASDLINYVRDPIGTATAQNYGGLTGNGAGVNTRLAVTHRLFVTGNYEYVYAEDQLSGQSGGNYPRHQGYVRGDWTIFKNIIWGNQLRWISDQDRVPTDPRASLPGYVLLDTILRGTIVSKDLHWTAAIRNLFDAGARDPSAGPGPTAKAAAIPNDIPLPGRNFFVELSYRF